jgi:hypothetical protein
MGPQHLPASGMLLAIALIAHTVAAILLSTVIMSASSAMLAGLVDTALLCAFTATLLYVQRLNVRVVQTVTAMAGSLAIISLIALPVSGWLHGIDETSGDARIPGILLLGLIGWSLAVSAHVFRHALSIPYYLGFILAIVFYWISISVYRSLFPLSA